MEENNLLLIWEKIWEKGVWEDVAAVIECPMIGMKCARYQIYCFIRLMEFNVKRDKSLNMFENVDYGVS